KNFWLIWISCAGKEEGVSLFKIQTDWGIKTNYLYHNEVGLSAPLFRVMVRENYIRKEGKKLKANFEWIPDYIRERYEVNPKENHWFPDSLVRIKWGDIQKFLEKYHPLLFSHDNIKLLYRDNKELIGKSGSNIFIDVFLYVLFSNMRAFCKKYSADVVLRIISTLISLSTERDLLNYIHHLDSKLKIVPDVPNLLKDETELSKMLCSLKW
ncbi:MAG: hypothetical protein KAS04_05205, partial [Candidatus Aenigmarchaeota archaeon]|nr:hypothetical protein [Candidatus Aenigmarchaeota archaeon]